MAVRSVEFFAIFHLMGIAFGFSAGAELGVNMPDHVIITAASEFEFDVRMIFLYSTHFNDISNEYNKSAATVQSKNGTQMALNMSADIEKMMAWKVQAIKRIADTAEEAMVDYVYDKNIKFSYINAKKLNENFEDSVQLTLTPDKNFYGLNVSTNTSSIHVPTNIYDKAPYVVNPIKATEWLNPIFASNYYLDPSLSWQYFGSSTGFLRQYPAIKWDQGTDDSDADVVDTFDCRLRPWYIEAAASPKDVVILIDSSGSMTGQRIEIAKHVARNILDTLSDNDYFAIFRFGNSLESLVPCFSFSLVPANMENIREYKRGLLEVNTSMIANFSEALTKAFEILLEYNRTDNGSMCNKAIMLITDGAPQMFEEIFNQYNSPARHVRVFTYVIGQEMTNVGEVQWMACTNRGYYSHISTIAEARDKVQEYIPVMARPLVLHRKHNVIWTSVYADKGDPKIADYLWETQEKKRQKLKSIQRLVDLKNKKSLNYSLEDIKNEISINLPLDEKPIYHLMTTVACPVFDRRNSSECVACILGVAATDVPIEEITKLTPAYKLGVNAYSFAITNNGYILFHPDLRPVYHDVPQILKPDYNSVDLTEVELPNNNLGPREYDDQLLLLRKKMIDRELNETELDIKIHLDHMKRVMTMTQRYFFAPLEGTPFSFGISIPKDYGMKEVMGMVDLNEIRSSRKTHQKVLSYFEDTTGYNWKIHPDWIYCQYLYGNAERPERTPEDSFLHFLKQIHNWKNQPRVRPLPTNEEQANATARELNRDEFYCDWDLVQSLIFDAELLNTLTEAKPSDNSTARKYGITVVFVATRSGLTRWIDFDEEGRDFIVNNSRAIDELWYKRAVDYYSSYNISLVFSATYDAGSQKDPLITVSHAVFLDRKNSGTAPAGVVGLQMRHSALLSIFESAFKSPRRSPCRDPSSCMLNCSSELLDCYLLDENGFVILSEDITSTGEFYGMVDCNVMAALVADGIYQKIQIVDYQSVCLEEVISKNAASLLFTPIVQLKHLLTWMWCKIVFFYINYSFYSAWKESSYFASAACQEKDRGVELDPVISAYMFRDNLARPEPCDRQYHLYRLQFQNLINKRPQRGNSSCSESRQVIHYVAHMVHDTNLLMLVVNVTNRCSMEMVTLRPRQTDTDTCVWLRSNIYRKRPAQCTSYHEQELEIEGQCGQGARMAPSRLVAFASVVILVLSFGLLHDWHINT